MVEETLKTRKIRFSLRLKLTVGLILMIGLLFAATNIFNILSHRKARRTEALNNAETVARLVAGSLVGELGNHPIESERVRVVVNNFLNAALILNKKNRDLAYAVVVTPEGKVVIGRAKPKITVFPGGKTYNEEKKILSEVARLNGNLGGQMRYKRFPLQLGNKVVGKLIVGTSFARLEKEVQKDLIFNMSMLGGTLLLLVLYSAFMLGRFVVSPLRKVVSAMHAVQVGDLDGRLDIKTADELGVLADSYNFMVSGLKERARLQDAFSRYVSDKVYAKFQSGEVMLTGEKRNATILFSDIRSFTTLSEQLDAAEVVTMLNEYFTRMVEVVFKYDGYLNKFIGDAIMAIYNVPVDQDRHELRAVYTALDMSVALDQLNAEREQAGLFPISIGIGINTGPVVAGNIGHTRRLEYTVIGDAVNLASRIESQTKVAGSRILISEYTHQAVADYVVGEKLPPIKVKGKSEPVNLYTVTGVNPNAPRA